MQVIDHTVFEYLYRDASNYKAWGELLLSGRLSDADLEAMRQRMEGGEFFIAEQLGIPTLYEALWRECNCSASPDDHVWHEFHDIRSATVDEIRTLPLWGSTKSLKEAMCGVSRWNEKLSRNWLGIGDAFPGVTTCR